MQSSSRNFFLDLLKLGAIILFIVVPIRVFIAQPFIVSGASMAPTFDSGEYLIVDQISYQFEEPARGDVIIFRFPYNPDTFFIKRVVGLPGETVTLRAGDIIIKNEATPEGFTLTEPYLPDEPHVQQEQTTTLGPNEYFVLGDNRDASSDSRKWGPLPEQFIVGKAFLRLLPVPTFSIYPGTQYTAEQP